jgi:hypothetical protein
MEAIGEKKMKKAACLIILCAAGSALALGPLGPTTTTMRQGQWEIGFAYTEGEQDIVLDDVSEMEDVELKSSLGRVAVGLATNRAELFGLFGLAKYEQEDSNPDLAVGVGARITATSEEELNWGIVAQIVRYEFDLDSTELRLNEIQVGIGPTWRPCRYFVLYGGPMLHFLFGEFDNDSGTENDIEEDSFFGGYLGVGTEIVEHLTVNIEGQVTADSRALSAGLAWRF